MLTWLLHRKLAAFETQFEYDASYLHHMLDTDRGAFLKFARATAIGKHRKDVPLEVHCAVGFTAIVAADCGPCAQLGVTMALREGVPGATIAAILRGDESAMTEPMRLGVQFARAVIKRDGAAADTARDALAQRYGRRAIVSLGLALCAAQLYPTMKWSLGHGQACQRIAVEGTSIVPARVVMT